VIYLNKALALFNTAMGKSRSARRQLSREKLTLDFFSTVTPTYFVLFTSCTLVTSIILSKGFHIPATDIVTVIMGFLVICVGISEFPCPSYPALLESDFICTTSQPYSNYPRSIQTRSNLEYSIDARLFSSPPLEPKLPTTTALTLERKDSTSKIQVSTLYEEQQERSDLYTERFR